MSGMAISYLCIVLAVLRPFVNSLERGSSCTTPNGESATCIPINSCNILKEAIFGGNSTAIEFAKKSQCGYDTEHLVCCGTRAYPAQHSIFDDIFTKVPPTERPVRKKPVGLSTIAGNSLPDRTLCGLERETPRLFGAEATGIDEFPWMALIGYRDKGGNHVGFKCGGTLINNRYVLTAAHCLFTAPEPFSAYNVRLGEWNLETERDCVEGLAISDCTDPVVDVVIKQEIPHPYYSYRNGNNDIALLLLETDVKYTDFIRPICLPPVDLPTPPEGTLMTVCGWGATEDGSQSTIKLKIEIPLVSNSECIKRITSVTSISPNQICAGGVEGKDACRGDSGGPLMRTYTDDTSQWYQEGLVSRGRGCGRRGFPGVYTRVSRYVNWILTNLGESDSD